MGLLSYKISNSYAYFTNSITGNSVIEMTYTKPNLDKSGANVPLLSSNMIPVYYDESADVWRKADSTNTSKNYKWYDYNNKIWANAVTVTETNRTAYLNAEAGTEIPISDINTMWVWVPRYTYTYFSSSTPVEINIKFESGTNSSGTISCADTATGESSTSETCTDSTNGSLKAGTSTYTHPAFWWDKDDDNVRDKDEELTGIWIGKFEVSSDITCTVNLDNAAIGKYCNLKTIRPKIIPNAISWRGAQVGTFFYDIYNMRESGNQYGFTYFDEVHMMKNMEWGAVTYLSHSKYGTCTNGICSEVQLNSYNSYMTGCGPQSNGSASLSSTCNRYNTNLGRLASTTGNIYGVYDMSGGAFEYLMGDLVYNDETMFSGQTGGYQHSSFTGQLYLNGTLYTGEYNFPSKRYYDRYSSGTNNAEYTRGKLGDASIEITLKTGNNVAWCLNTPLFPVSEYPWFARGDGIGLFSFFYHSGGSSSYYSTRAVISNLS